MDEVLCLWNTYLGLELTMCNHFTSFHLLLCLGLLGLQWQSTTKWVLYNRNWLSHSFAGWMLIPSVGCEDESVPGLVPPCEGLLAGCGALLLWKHQLNLCLCLQWHSSCGFISLPVSPFYKDSSHWGLMSRKLCLILTNYICSDRIFK